MKLCVCIKQVPDVQASVQTGRMVLNAYDASAVEAALVLVEENGGGVDLVLIGPEGATETIRKALAMGAERATHLVADAELDSLAISGLLAEHFEGRSYDAIFTGKQSQDTDSGLAGSMLAARLDLPYVTNAVGLEAGSSGLVVTRQGDAGQEVIEVAFPCLVTCSNDMNDPRIPALKGIMAARKKSIETHSPESIPEPRVRVLETHKPPEREPGVLLEGDPDEQVAQLLAKLTGEARVL